MHMRVLTEQDFFRTSDFCLAATLAVWLPLASVDRSNPRRTAFIFERSAELDELLEAFHKRDLRVEPQEFYSAVRLVKSRLYEEE